MKHFIQAILVVIVFLLLAGLSEAQVYVPGPGYPICHPQTVATPDGLVTIIVCQ